MVHLDKVCLLLLGPEVGLEGGHVGDELNLLSAGVHRLPARVDNQRHRLRQLLRFWNINLDTYTVSAAKREPSTTSHISVMG